MAIPRKNFTHSLKKVYDYIDNISVKIFSTIPSTMELEVGENEQYMVYGDFTVDGTVTISGDLRVAAWPT